MMASGGVGRYGLGVDFAVVIGVMVAGVAIGPRLEQGLRQWIDSRLSALSGHPSALRDWVLQRPSVLPKQRLSVLRGTAAHLLTAQV